MKIQKLLLALLGLSLVSSLFADSTSNNMSVNQYKQSFFYGGLIGGYADVDWSSVVSQPGWNNATVTVANPYSASGTGLAYGVDLGYQFSPHFDVEGQYIRMPTSQLDFFPDLTIFGHELPFNLYGITSPSIDSNMDFWSVIFKVMVPLGHTGFSLFVDAGPAYQWQTNQIANIGTFAPTFGGGLDYRISQHFFAEGSFQYAPGTGESIPNPMTAFIPEIYVETFKLNYIF